MRSVFTPLLVILSFIANAQDGSPDPNFGNHGDGTSTSAGSNALNDHQKLIVLPNGKLLQCFGAANSTLDFGLIQYNADGATDTSGSFGGHTGIVTTDFGMDEVATSM